jgi:hypothetical protein
MSTSFEQVWLPDLLYTKGRFLSDTALAVDSSGRVLELLPAQLANNPIRLRHRPSNESFVVGQNIDRK